MVVEDSVIASDLHHLMKSSLAVALTRGLYQASLVTVTVTSIVMRIT